MKKVKTLICAATAFAAAGSFAFAQAPAPAPAETTTGSWLLIPSYASQYMFRGTRLGGQSFQPTVEYDYGSLAVGVWANFPLAGKVPGQSDPEFDFYGTYSFTLSDSLTLVPGFTLYTYPDADKNAGFYKDTFEPNIALNYTIGGLKLTPKLYYDMVLKGPTAELTAAFAVPLKDAGTELDFTATYGSFIWDEYAENTSPSIKNWGDYWLIGVAAPFQLTKESKITVGVAYTKGSNNELHQYGVGTTPNAAAVGRTVITVSYAYTF